MYFLFLLLCLLKRLSTYLSSFFQIHTYIQIKYFLLQFTLPMHSPIPGSELTKEPFRWDQRLFSLVLRLSGTPAIERDTGLVASDASPIDAMCEVTGGRSYCITSHRMMMQCIDSLVQKVQSGVVINFEKIGPDPPLLANEATHPDDEDIKEENGMANGPRAQQYAAANLNNPGNVFVFVLFLAVLFS